MERGQRWDEEAVIPRCRSREKQSGGGRTIERQKERKVERERMIGWGGERGRGTEMEMQRERGG